MYYLGYAKLKQLDLSDDQVVAAIAADDWENAMTRIGAGAEDVMTREGFYQLVSLVPGGSSSSSVSNAEAEETQPMK